MEICLGRVNMKPGKPTTFATCASEGRNKYFLCLPGNPVSATVTMHLFALPLLRLLCKDSSMPIIVKTKVCNIFGLTVNRIIVQSRNYLTYISMVVDVLL